MGRGDAGAGMADAGNETTDWPITAEAFLAGNYLQRADIVLCRGKRSLFSKLIRWATKSHFSHAALVFLIPSRHEGFEKTFLVEAVPSGVDLTDLSHYLIDKRAEYDVVIRRFERDWFSSDVQKLVRGHMLDFIKADYDFRAIWHQALAAIRRLWFGLRAGFQGLGRTVRAAHDSGRLAPTQFVCSGFVQYGFVSAIRRLAKAGMLPDAAVAEVLFNPDLTPRSDTSAILATTPEDLARSPHLAWKYVIVKGKAYAVSSAAEAAKLLGETKVVW